MPSLRRTASTPIVRSSPYSSAPVAARGHPNRRSSGSETTNRRVLADIEWWRVTEGQCDPSSDQGSEDHIRGAQDNGTVHLDMSLSLDIPPLPSADGVEHPTSLSSFHDTTTEGASSSEINYAEPPTEQFSALTITPSTPPRSRHGRESTSSSVESTPETADTTRLNSGLDLDLSFADMLAPPPAVVRRPQAVLAPAMKRSFTFADCLSLKDDYPGQYADFTMSPLSSAPNFLN